MQPGSIDRAAALALPRGQNSDPRLPINRRELIGGLIAGSTLPSAGRSAEPLPMSGGTNAPRGTISLEDHFLLPSSFPTTFHPYGIPDAAYKKIEARLLDVTAERLPLMDAHGVDMQIVSLTANGIQGETNTKLAIDNAKRSNDWLLEKFIKPFPKRFGGFAAVALQDPAAAVAETERAIKELGFRGVLIDGFVNGADDDSGEYLDLPKFTPFWECTQSLGVPVYLHPRAPLPTQREIYKGHDELMGPMWAFGAETAVHALRLITSGLFDRFPRQQLILGHMGEGLVAMMARAQRRFEYASCGKVLRKPLSQYMRDNFFITTSGNFHSPTLRNVIEEVGIDRVMFSVDYPYESIDEGATWFANCFLEGEDRLKVARLNAQGLLRV